MSAAGLGCPSRWAEWVGADATAATDGAGALAGEVEGAAVDPVVAFPLAAGDADAGVVGAEAVSMAVAVAEEPVAVAPLLLVVMGAEGATGGDAGAPPGGAGVELITRADCGWFSGSVCSNCTVWAAAACNNSAGRACADGAAGGGEGAGRESCTSPPGVRLSVMRSPLFSGARVISSNRRLLASTWMRKTWPPRSPAATCLTTAATSRPPAGSS